MTTDDVLEQRLTDFAFETPDAGRITARVLSERRAPRRRYPRVLAIGVATVVIAAAVLYFVPAADAGLADAPVAGDLLRDAGLVGAGNRVTAVGAVASSSGYRLELVAAYADSTRTVLIVRAEPGIGLGGFPQPELTDQFGRTYQWNSGMSDSRTGEVIMEFDALAWPDALTGARITLHWSAVQPAACSTVLAVCQVAGSWTLPAIIGIDEGTVLALPAPGRLGNANFRITSVVSTPATIAVDLEVTGMSMEDLNQIAPDGGKGTPRLSIDLIGPDGSSANMQGGGGGESSDDLVGVHMHYWWPRNTASGGDYHLHIAYLGLGEFDRVLHVPGVLK